MGRLPWPEAPNAPLAAVLIQVRVENLAATLVDKFEFRVQTPRSWKSILFGVFSHVTGNKFLSINLMLVTTANSNF